MNINFDIFFKKIIIIIFNFLIKKIALNMKMILKNEQFRNTIDFLYKKYCKYTF